jgi:peptidoglycan hydrolase-like protein with peptidoglycan-binding domain
MRVGPRLSRSVAVVISTVVALSSVPADGQNSRPGLDSGDADLRGLWESAKRGFRLQEGPDATPAWADPGAVPEAGRRPNPAAPVAAKATVEPSETDVPPGETAVAAKRTPGACERSEVTHEEMRELQAILSEIRRADGDAELEIDGLCGPRTLAAIRQFERRERMAANGVPSLAVLGHAREVGATLANRNMAPPPLAGSEGEVGTEDAASVQPVPPPLPQEPEAPLPAPAAEAPAPADRPASGTMPAMPGELGDPLQPSGDRGLEEPVGTTPAPPADGSPALAGDPELWRAPTAPSVAPEPSSAGKLASSPQTPLY